MRKTTYICVCLLLLLCVGFTSAGHRSLAASDTKSQEQHGGEIEAKYDGFNYETTITLKKMRIVCGASKNPPSTLKNTCVFLVASLRCPGTQLNYVKDVRLQLVFEAKDWDSRHPLGQRDLVAVADGQTLRLGTMFLANQDLDTNRGVDVMKEVLEVSIPYKVFTKIATAQSVEMRVGATLFGLKDKNLWALRDLNNRVKP